MLGCLAGCGANSSSAPRPTEDAKPVLVFAAASTTNVLDQIKSAFEKQNGGEVRANYAASSALAQQIANGAEADLFLSADLKWADHVAGKTPIARRRNLLGNRLVLIVPSNSSLKLQKLDDLTSADVKHLALGDPAAVPVGRYAKQALTKLGLWDKVQGKVAPAEDVRHALTYVETGAAEAGIVYATDARVSTKVRVVLELPADLTEPVRYLLLLLERAKSNPKAAAFYDYLGSPEARKVFENAGFQVLDEAEGKGK
jgi:molybdate transport system substrate-binding protein